MSGLSITPGLSFPSITASNSVGLSLHELNDDILTFNAVSLDGTNDWLGSAVGVTTDPLLSGLNSSETNFTLSCWLNFAGKGAQEQVLSIATSTTNRVSIFSNAAGNLGIILVTSAGVTTLNIADTGAQIANDPGGGGLPAITWYHLYLTYDGTNLVAYVNGVSAATSSAGVGGWQGNLPVRIGARGSGAANKLLGSVAQYWFDDNLFPAASNIDKFFSNGKARSLGSDGSIPTGSPPRVFLSFANPLNFGENFGSDNDFPVNGAPILVNGPEIA